MEKSTISRINNKPQKDRGFSLVEVLVALAVVAIALAGLLEGLGNYARHYSDLQQRFWGQNVAWNSLSKIVVAQEVGRFESLSTSGSTQQLGAKWTWEINQEKTAANAVVRLDIQVNPEGLSSGTRLSTMIMRGSGFNRNQFKDE